jgi:hypothetical protein
MQYKVVSVHEQSSSTMQCCAVTKEKTSIDDEIQQACDREARRGYVLVTAYAQQMSSVTVVNASCASAARGIQGSAVGAILIFAKQS